jgi:hypothetical protein
LKLIKKELKGELMIWRMKVKAKFQLASNQFPSNESKLVPTNLNPGPHLVGLSIQRGQECEIVVCQIQRLKLKHKKVNIGVQSPHMCGL